MLLIICPLEYHNGTWNVTLCCVADDSVLRVPPRGFSAKMLNRRYPGNEPALSGAAKRNKLEGANLPWKPSLFTIQLMLTSYQTGAISLLRL